MREPDSPSILAVATAVADGVEIEWESMQIGDEGATRVLAQLRVIQQITRVLDCRATDTDENNQSRPN